MNLWSANTPQQFWRCQPDLLTADWQAATQQAAPVLGLASVPETMDALLEAVLGEGQFGAKRWTLGRAKRLYYVLKPLLPRRLTQRLRQVHRAPAASAFPIGWPIEERWVRFQYEVVRNVLERSNQPLLNFIHFWPHGQRFAFVLTHDIETAQGQAFVRQIAALEESFGFRSSFNFIPERYPLDRALLEELRERGFEVGVHGLKHDGKLFNSHALFMRRAARINHYLQEFGAVGFRTPLLHRQPEWMQALQVEYDLSFFDTDPFEPMPGGVMNIWPFMIGHFVELPYTLVQDYTLTAVLGERTARHWLTKVDFIAQHHGMALVNTHPDYLKNDLVRNVYVELLQAVSKRNDYWHALPRDVAHWWRARDQADTLTALPGATLGQVHSAPTGILIEHETVAAR